MHADASIESHPLGFGSGLVWSGGGAAVRWCAFPGLAVAADAMSASAASAHRIVRIERVMASMTIRGPKTCVNPGYLREEMSPGTAAHSSRSTANAPQTNETRW